MRKIKIHVSHIDETNKYWADSQLCNKNIELRGDETVHSAIGRAIKEVDYAEMSYNGKPQGNIYKDSSRGESQRVGYIYRTKHCIEDRGENIYKENVPFTTWVEVLGEVSDLKPVEIENIDG